MYFLLVWWIPAGFSCAPHGVALFAKHSIVYFFFFFAVKCVEYAAKTASKDIYLFIAHWISYFAFTELQGIS